MTKCNLKSGFSFPEFRPKLLLRWESGGRGPQTGRGACPSGSLPSRDDKWPAGVSAPSFCRCAGLRLPGPLLTAATKGRGGASVQTPGLWDPAEGSTAWRTCDRFLPKRSLNSGQTHCSDGTAHSALGVQPEPPPSSSARITGSGRN